MNMTCSSKKMYMDLKQMKFNIHICKTSSTQLHSHPFFELAYVLSGSAIHWLDGEERLLKKGDYLIMDYDAQHNYIKNEDEEFELINCLFLPEFIDKTLKDKHNFGDIVNSYMIKLNNSVVNISPTNNIFSDEDGYIGHLLKCCLTEFDEKKTGCMEIIRCKLIEIIILTMRKNSGNTAITLDPLCERIIKYTSENLIQKDVLKSVSDEVNFSISHLSRRFKDKMGITFTEYLQRQRIEQSLSLLINTDKKVIEIAELCGYSDMKFFNSLFKKNVGLTPREFRKNFC